MKKIKFLNGMSAVFALAMVALATTFTSCEKEEFNVDVKPTNAKAVISPIVMFTGQDGLTKDVTAAANITANPGLEFNGTPALAETTATVNVEYTYTDAVTNTPNTLKSQVVVKVSALQAGQFATYTPTILLTAPASNMETHKEQAQTQTLVAEENGYIINDTDYMWNTTRTIKARKGADNAVVTYAPEATETEKAFLDNIARGLKVVEYKEEHNFVVYAKSRTNINVKHMGTAVKVEYFREAATKAAKVLVGTVAYDEYAGVKVTSETNKGYDGTGHGNGINHGHGLGHGQDANAGGGIIMAD